MIRLLKKLIQISNRYPYNSFWGKFMLLDYFLLRLFPQSAFHDMSIIPLVKQIYDLDSDEEFMTRYHLSRVGFEDLWKLHPRESKGEIEHFYEEHDKDIWRQAYLSRYSRTYKKKILLASHIIKRSVGTLSDPILDYGCGAGVLAYFLASKGFTSIDVADIKSQTLDFVKKSMSSKLRNIICAGDENNLAAEEYKVIVTLDVLEHTVEPLQIVRNLLNALRPGGILVISFPIETDFSLAHTRRAQAERDKTMKLISDSCETVVPEFIYRKIIK